jgi:threonyl-tRNA synthetase
LVYSSESLGKIIAETTKQKVPYILVVGEKEEKNETVAVRKRNDKNNQETKKIDDFLKNILKEIKEKKL